jgi:hypothetical protein
MIKEYHVQRDTKNLPVIYNSLLAYINTVVTFRFTTLSLYLAAVAIILGGNLTFGKYFLLILLTISLYIIEIRNRILKNELEAQAIQIQKHWHYYLEGDKDHYPKDTTIFGYAICVNKDAKNNKKEKHLIISHSLGIDILYFSIFLYAVIHLLILSIPFLMCLLFSLPRMW